MKKSNLVREMMAQVEDRSEANIELLIKQVQFVTGFQRQLARAYINNNWARVDAMLAESKSAVDEMTTQAMEEVVEMAAAEEQPVMVDKAALKRARDAQRKREQRAAARAAAV
jgi:hypothetical protein